MSENDKRKQIARATVGTFMLTDRLHHQVVDAYIGEETRIHRSQHMILMYLAHAKNQPSQKDLAVKFKVTAACIAVTMKKLENGGYITRCATPEDNRRNVISITDKGRGVIRKSEEIFCAVDMGMIEGISAEELDNMSKTLEKIRDNLKNMLENSEKSGKGDGK